MALSIKEIKKLINYTIDNNAVLEKDGKRPIAICLEADAGIGKTSIVEQVAQEREMTFTKLSLHELEEAGDLVGFPQMEYECQVKRRVQDKDGNFKVKVLDKTVWLNSHQLKSDDPNMKYVQTGKTRMAYAKPAWVPEYNENGCIFLLDDFGRCNQQLSQAVMELILTQGYVSWKLPKKTSIILTSNPDNGQYNVSSMDPAQRTRFLTFNLAFDINSWMAWAEKEGIDGRCINFVASYYNELFNTDEDGNSICNPRSFVMFANMISGVADWDSAESLSFITTVSKGCFKDDGDRFSKMFNMFIRNKMHLLPQPKNMLLDEWSKEKPILEAALYDSTGQYRPDIASLLERRFVNYVAAWLKSEDKTPIAKVEKRIIDFLDADKKGGKMLFNKDLFYHMIKEIISDNKRQTYKLMSNPKIANAVS